PQCRSGFRLSGETPNGESSLRFMNWSNEPATEIQLSRLRQLGYSTDCPLTKGEAAYLIKILEEQTKTQGTAEPAPGQHLVKHMAYALRLAIEHTRRALAEAASDQVDRLQHSLSSAIAKRREFWTDTCREMAQMHCRS